MWAVFSHHTKNNPSGQWLVGEGAARDDGLEPPLEMGPYSQLLCEQHLALWEPVLRGVGMLTHARISHRLTIVGKSLSSAGESKPAEPLGNPRPFGHEEKGRRWAKVRALQPTPNSVTLLVMLAGPASQCEHPRTHTCTQTRTKFNSAGCNKSTNHGAVSGGHPCAPKLK